MKLSNSNKGEVLVAVMNNRQDWEIANEQRWYRIPVNSAPRRFPPEWLAFYQTKVFGEEAFAVRYVARVTDVSEVTRGVLFPNERQGARSQNRYYKLTVSTIKPLSRPIRSLRFRRLVFIPTTLFKLEAAEEINDLFDESPLEDVIWSEMKNLAIPAERQYYLQRGKDWFALDFAVFCRDGKIDIEADGDTWHLDSQKVPEDNERNNAMASLGWKVLRFNGNQIRESLREYCIPEIVKTVNRLGGLDDSMAPPRTLTPTQGGIAQQFGLFEGSEGYPKRSE